MATIEQGILQWAGEVEVLLDACRQLTEYYGTDAELDCFQKGVEAPLWFLGALKLIAAGKEVDTSGGPPLSKFVPAEALAGMLSPLLRLVAEWEPDFVADARETLDERGRKRITVPYGQFIGTVGVHLCYPIWTTYPHLAPPGWST